jgi:endonuclease YncB( thermonuclease family)
MTDMRAAILGLALATALAGAAIARERGPATVEGPARIVDGDTLDVGGTRIRLAGMDAPEREQVCRDENATAYRCGDRAADALVRLVAGARVTCRTEGTDRYRRTLATCATAQQADLGLAMIREGWATVYDGGPVPSEYRAAEEAARRRKVGLWRGPFERPSVWRRQHLKGEGIAHA